jgi:hypothetical protein
MVTIQKLELFSKEIEITTIKKNNGFHNFEMTCWKAMKIISSNFDYRKGNQARRQQ